MNSLSIGLDPVRDTSLAIGIRKFPTLTFVDRKSFKNLQSRDFKITDFVKVVSNFSEQHSAISSMTQEYMRYLNNRMYYILFGINLDYGRIVETADSNYIKDLFYTNLVNEYAAPDVFYEILPVSDTEYLVVLENGFLNYLTSTKSASEEFVLACLRCIDQFKCDKSQLTRLYLNLRLIPDYSKLLAIRVR